MTLKKETLLKYKTRLHDVFIESGTYEGGAVSLALECGFKRIESVEISEKYASFCKKKFANNAEVSIIHGDSYTIFPKLCEDLTTPAMFWLDGHYDRFSDTMGVVKCPLLKELDSIKTSKIDYHLILIDDLRVFGNTNEIDWGVDLNLEMIIAKIKEINPSYVISYENGWSKNDILVAYV